jgi:hypothetical protein
MCARSLHPIIICCLEEPKRKQTFLVRADDGQVNRTVQSRLGKSLKLLGISVHIHNIRVMQASSVIHEHALYNTALTPFSL